MEAKELRIGNWVNDVGDGCIITEIQDGDDIDFAKDYNPIPLTEEWLIKFGLQHKSFSFDHERLHKDIGVGYNGDDFINNEMSLLYKKKVLFKIQYVHQLQNLYFALTNEELTIKEK